MKKMCSPDEIMAAAKETMLDGKEPESEMDWVKIFNFLATNIAVSLEVSCCLLISKLYNCPLSERQIIEIARFQYREKIGNN